MQTNNKPAACQDCHWIDWKDEYSRCPACDGVVVYLTEEDFLKKTGENWN